MKHFNRLAKLGVCLAALAACSHQSLPATAPLASNDEVSVPARRAPAAYGLVYTFKGGTDGSNPNGDLIESHGSLYGTTMAGGTGNLGTVFRVTADGNEDPIYRFTGVGNGNTPIAGVTRLHGTLYAVSSAQAFALTPAGASFRVVYSFDSTATDDSVEGPLVAEKHVLYGVTRFGGLNGRGCTDRCGSVFSLTPAGAEKAIYQFRGGSDGGEPAGGLVVVKGNLYGTTLYGGTHGAGTVFKVTPSGAHQVLFSFNRTVDGGQPTGKLCALRGVLYGTAKYGGKNDGGTVFAVSLTGHASILHAFGGPGDAGTPNGSLTAVNGVLYGTSAGGGPHNVGTVFAISKNGTERVVYSFSGSPPVPDEGFINLHGTLYGVTQNGGPSKNGTIYKIRTQRAGAL